MDNEGISQLIKAELKDASVSIEGDGYHYQLIIESLSFEGLNKVKRQQLVYKALHSVITSGDLHAVSLETYAPSENRI